MTESLPLNRYSLVGAPRYRVCVAVSGATIFELRERTLAALAEVQFAELRLDSLDATELQSGSVGALLGILLTAHPSAQVVATCRQAAAGGGFSGTAAEELSLLLEAAAAGATLADLSVESADELGQELVAAFKDTLHRAGAGLILSFHDFQQTRALEETVERLAQYDPDILKVVSTATTLVDNLPVLRLLARSRIPHHPPLVAIAMGEAGLVSRALGPAHGAIFTFASASAGAETAPGQVSASTLRKLYQVEQISPATRVYGVAGKPITHSLSPLMLNAAFQARFIDAGDTTGERNGSVYLPLVTGSAEDLVHLARELPLHGVSVTMPLKQAILPLLDWVDPLTARVGACNTVVRVENGELHGYNTDVAGVVAPLEKRISLKGARVLVLGAGGAARAAVFGLRERGAEVWILNRTLATAAALAAESGAMVLDPESLAAATSAHPGHGRLEFDVLINSIPADMVGMAAGTEPAPQSDETESGLERAGDTAGLVPGLPRGLRIEARLVFDMIYNPIKTPLLERARAQGVAVISGAEMFVHQGARQFELWTGLAAPEAEMERVVLEALLKRERQVNSATA